MTNIIDTYNTLYVDNPMNSIVYAQEFYPSPTSDDYTNQTIERFFVKAVNKNKIIEVAEDNYNNCTSFLYIKTNIYWRIAGSVNNIVINNNLQRIGVQEFNRSEINGGNMVIDGLNKKLTNLLEFYKAS